MPHADAAPLIVGLLIFIASLFSLETMLSVAIFETLLGVAAGALGLKAEPWMLYLAGFGGIVLTFLAGSEIDVRLLREKFVQSFTMGALSFLIPFLAATAFAYFVAHWTLTASLLAGTTLSTTSLAVVYSVLVETGLSKSEIGKLIMAATFITNMGSALALSILFIKPTAYTLVFIAASVVVIVIGAKFSHLVFDNPKLKNKVIEPEIKYIFLMLLAFIYFASVGNGQAILPAFLLGLFMSRHFTETAGTIEVRNRLRTVAYALVTPIFFIVGGLKISLPALAGAFGLFVVFFLIKIIMKFLSVYFLARKFVPAGSVYTTLLMSTGLTFGTIASVFGLAAGIINQTQYSVLIGVVIASAVIPTFIAQKWFMPVEEEDLVEMNGTA